jgi:lysophospholipase L1-like esterase
MLDKLAPDIVLIMVGFNDFWTPKEQVGSNYEQTLLQRIKAKSRLYRAALMWQRQRIAQHDITFGSPRPSEHVNAEDFNNPANIEKHLMRMDGESFYLGTRQGEPAKNMKSLGDNLAAMIAMVRARGADAVLITYPSNWGFYPHASKWIRKAAEQNSVALLDITPAFVSLCVDGPASCPEDLFPDGHATAKGNAVVAKQVSDFLLANGLVK